MWAIAAGGGAPQVPARAAGRAVAQAVADDHAGGVRLHQVLGGGAAAVASNGLQGRHHSTLNDEHG